jgi:hypothetical protein
MEAHSVSHSLCHRDAPVTCLICGRRVRRKARQQVYCSPRCRDRGKDRSRKPAIQPLKNAPRYPYSGAPPNPPKNTNGFNSLQAQKGGSSLPREAWRAVVEVEIWGGHVWHAVVSSDGVACQVNDLRPRTFRDGRVR